MNSNLHALLKISCIPKNGEVLYAIDVGAHHGVFSRDLVDVNLFDKVLAFEPHPISYVTAKNAVKPNIKCEYEILNFALGSDCGSSEFYCNEDTSTASLLPYDAEESSSFNPKIHDSVPVQTLDVAVRDRIVDGRVAFIKIDTQGNDLAVLVGAKSTIATHRPIIQTEFIYVPLYKRQCSPSDLAAVLSEMDYKFYSMNNIHVNVEGRMAYCDAVFIPKEMNVLCTSRYICIDDEKSYQTQIEILTNICAERLSVINLLDTEVKRLKQPNSAKTRIYSLLLKIKSWVQ